MNLYLLSLAIPIILASPITPLGGGTPPALGTYVRDAAQYPLGLDTRADWIDGCIEDSKRLCSNLDKAIQKQTFTGLTDRWYWLSNGPNYCQVGLRFPSKVHGGLEIPQKECGARMSEIVDALKKSWVEHPEWDANTAMELRPANAGWWNVYQLPGSDGHDDSVGTRNEDGKVSYMYTT